MVDPERLSPAQERALTRTRQEGRLYSRDGVSAPSIQCLEQVGLVRVLWSRRNVTARYSKAGWRTHVRIDWVAEPVIEDYQVFLKTEEREACVTVYSAVSVADAIDKAKIRFWECYCGGVEIPVVALKTESLSIPFGLLR